MESFGARERFTKVLDVRILRLDNWFLVIILRTVNPNQHFPQVVQLVGGLDWAGGHIGTKWSQVPNSSCMLQRRVPYTDAKNDPGDLTDLSAKRCLVLGLIQNVNCGNHSLDSIMPVADFLEISSSDTFPESAPSSREFCLGGPSPLRRTVDALKADESPSRIPVRTRYTDTSEAMPQLLC